MIKYVLDASALLALINEEDGADIVIKALPFSIMSAINISEVAATLMLMGISKKECESTIMWFITKVEPFDESQAYGTSALRPLTKSKGLSLGDRACLNLGKLKNLTVLTADKVWSQIDCGVNVQFIR